MTLETTKRDPLSEMIHRLEELLVREVSPVDRGANKKRFLIIKQAGLAPHDDMDQEQLRDLRERRGREFGIEVIEKGSSDLTFAEGFPTKLEQYADPVNLKFPIHDKEHAANARRRFAQTAGSYLSDCSKATVLEQIVRGQLGFDMRPDFDPDNALDRLLPADLRERLTEKDTMTTKAKLAPTVKADVIRMLERADETAAKVEAQVKAASDIEGDASPGPLTAAVGSVATILRGILSKHRVAASKADDDKADEDAAAEAADKATKVELTIPKAIRGKVLGALEKVRAGIKTLRSDVDAAEEGEDETEHPFPENMAKILETMAGTLDAAIGRKADAGKADDGKADEDEQHKADGEEDDDEAAAAAKAAAKAADDKAAKQVGGGHAGQMKEAIKILEGIAPRLTPGKSVDPAAAASLKKAIEILRASMSSAPADAEGAKKADGADEADDTEKAGRPQMSAARGKAAMAAIGTLIKVLQGMIPEAERKGWPTRKADDRAEAEAAKAAELEKAAADTTAAAGELAAAKGEIATLRKQLDAAEQIAAPSNVDAVDKSNGGGSPKSEQAGLPYDANDPDFLSS